MAQKSAKKKAKKSAKRPGDASVLGSLRSTRPSRIGGDRRGSAPRAAATATPPATATKPPAAKPTKPKAAKPKPVKAKVKPTKRVVPGPEPARTPPAPAGRPSGTEIVTTAVQAAGELAQIGATVGSQLIKRAARRIPRP
jgi:hypothetical protein